MFELITFVLLTAIGWVFMIWLGDRTEYQLREEVRNGLQYYGMTFSGAVITPPRPSFMSERTWLFVTMHEHGHVAHRDDIVLCIWNAVAFAAPVCALFFWDGTMLVVTALAYVLYPALRVMQEVRADAYAVRMVGLPDEREFMDTIDLLAGDAAPVMRSKRAWAYGYPPLTTRVAMLHRAANRA